jgi:asparagine synthetase B (glutamine-hydrolysing)
MKVAFGGERADELFAGYPNFAVQRFAPAMRLVPATVGRVLRCADTALLSASGYMHRRFLLGQLAHGFVASIERQSFLWIAPLAPDRLAALWRRGPLPTEALAEAFAPIDRLAAEAAGLAPVDLLLYLFLATYLACRAVSSCAGGPGNTS